ncbi:MAG: hypothetical protein K9M57_04960, partial [Phycisphaerae bacterium]|nr:hypothetical protein [Phycisphaerae bacterium]
MQTEYRKINHSELETALKNARETLLESPSPGGHWGGELSRIPLAPATAIVALSRLNRDEYRNLIANGLQ